MILKYPLFTSWIAANLFDMAVTIYGLSIGHSEMNPTYIMLYSNSKFGIWTLFIQKWVIVLLLCYALESVKSEKWNRYLTRTVIISSYIVWIAVIWNVIIVTFTKI